MEQYIDGITLIEPKAQYGGLRFDFYVETRERKIFIEVKGITLEEGDVVLFPDAPTKTRREEPKQTLAKCVWKSYGAQVVFVVQMNNMLYFTQNNKTHLAFDAALVAGEKAGIKVTALDCVPTENSLSIDDSLAIKF